MSPAPPGPVRIENAFEGANPRRRGEVRELAPGRWLARPWSEDGDGNYKFCLNVKAVNGSGGEQPLDLEIDWDDLEYMDCRDYVLVGRGAEWRSFPAAVERMTARVRVTLPPGESYIGLHPVYDAAMLAADRERARAAGFAEEVIGRSHEGRELFALSLGAAGAPAVLVVARFHPYETAGSFCVSAMLEMLSAERAAGGGLGSAWRFVFVPVTNPDGVAAGCCKRSRRGGPDLCHQGAEGDDPAGRALAALLARTAPRGYLDLHGWMFRDHDGLSYSHPAAREAFAAALAGDALFSKEWKGGCSGERPLVPGDFCSRAFHDHGAVGFIISPSWFGRSVPQMREFGRKTLAAFCRALSAR
jgi:hypothetical protein